MSKLDVIVIGAGQSGPSLAARMAAAGKKVALVERRGLGGTCVNDGCIPTKTLVASARAAWVVNHAARYGVDIGGPVSVDMKRVKARKDAVVQESRDSLQQWLGGLPNLRLIEGTARFDGPRSVVVGDERLEAELIFVNTGGRAIVPPMFAGVPHLTNTTMMDVDFVPPHLVVVGGSYIGLEFAQMYRRFGSRVTVIEAAPRLVPREDDDVAAEIKRILALEDIAILEDTEVVAAASSAQGVTLTTRSSTLACSHVLLAIGRIPNTDDLGLAQAGVTTDARGYIVVDDQLRTSNPAVFALGDVNGRGAFTHTSYNDYEIAAENLLEGGSRRVSERIPIYGLFIDPPLGRVGMNEREARASGRRVLVGKRLMTRVGRARERGETAGFIKILVDGDSKEILGAAILGVEGDEAIHVLADVMYARAPYTVVARAVHAHPTVSELLPTTLQDLKPLR